MKKSNLFKVTAAAVAFILCLGIIASCGPATTARPAAGGSAAPSGYFNATGYPIVNEPITVNVLHSSGAQDGDRNELLFSKRMEELTGITMVYEAVDSTAWEETINLRFASQEFPDFLWHSLNVIRETMYGVEGGMFYDLTGYIADYMPNINKWFNQYPQDYNVLKAIDGKIYSLPYLIGTATILGDTHYIRTDMMVKAGLTKKPSTVDEYFNTLTVMRDAGIDPEFIPLLMRPGTNPMSTLEGFLFNAFGEATDPYLADDGSGKVIFNVVSDQYRLMLDFVRKLYEEKLLDQEFFTRTDNDAIAINLENLCGITNMGTLYTIANNFESGTYDVELFPPLVSEYTNNRKLRGYNQVSGIGNGAISVKCQYPEALARWMDILYYLGDEEQIPGTGFYDQVGWLGFRGETWERFDDGTYKRLIPEGIDMSEVEYMSRFIIPGTGPMANVIWDIPVGSDSQRMKAMQSNEHLFPYLKPLFPISYLRYTESEMDVYSSRYTEIVDTYTKMMKAQFVTGELELNDANWNNFVNEVNRMGLEDLLRAVQSSYDRMKG